MVAKKIVNEFKEFVNDYKIITLVIALILGQAAKDLSKSFVDNIFMPIINPIIPTGNWEEFVVYFGPIHLKLGLFISSLLNFLILALIIFIVVKKLMTKPKAEEKK